VIGRGGKAQYQVWNTEVLAKIGGGEPRWVEKKKGKGKIRKLTKGEKERRLLVTWRKTKF